MADMVIRKYTNRKLYETGLRRYVTLTEIAERVRSGDGVSVVAKATGLDITASVLASAIEAEVDSGTATYGADVLMTVIRAAAPRSDVAFR